MKDDPLSDLETRLCQDAARVLEMQTRAAPIADLLERHAARKRRERRVRSIGLTLLAMSVPAAWAAFALLRPSPSDIAPAGMPTPAAPSEIDLVAAPPSGPGPVVPNHAVSPSATHGSSDIVPIVLLHTNADGEQVLIPGLYIPERSESIDFSRLSQAQQRAVRAVLGLEKKPDTRRPI